MTAPVSIVGFVPTDFVPGFVGEVVFGAGAISASNVPIKLLLVGNKLAAGSKTADSSVDAILSEENAIAYYGTGSEMHLMAQGALRTPNVVLFGAPNAEAAGDKATITITFTGTAGSAGEFALRAAGRRYAISVLNGDANTVSAAALKAKIDQDSKAPFTAGIASNVVTLTWRQFGVRGNQAVCFLETNLAPTVQTVALGGAGSAVTGGGKQFGGGTGADSVTNVATLTFASWFERVALAQNDATNLAAWETHNDAKAAPLEGRTEQVIVAHNASLVSTTSLAQTTLNNARFQMLWMLNSESHPVEIAAAWAAVRAVTERADPDAAYDDAVIPGIVAHSQPADIPQRATQLSALQNSVTPVSSKDGKAVIVRSITTKSLNGATPDYRTLDTYHASVADFMRLSAALLWEQYKIENPRIQDEPAPGEPEPPSGTGTPKTWNIQLWKLMKDMQQGRAVSSGRQQIVLSDDNGNLLLPVTGWDNANKAFVSVIPTKAAPNQHKIGVSVRQL